MSFLTNIDELLKRNQKYITKLRHEYPQKRFKREIFDKRVFYQLQKLIKNKATETDIHSFLEQNPQIFGQLLRLYRTGHHSFTVYSKQELTPHIKDKNKGMIPDFIIGGENSDGWQWWIIELKSPSDPIFIEKGGWHFSDVANKGICQLMEYVSMSNKIQGHLRDHFGFKDFNNPRGILLIGSEDEFTDPKKQNLKRSFNNFMTKQFEIRTFSWLLREFEILCEQ